MEQDADICTWRTASRTEIELGHVEQRRVDDIFEDDGVHGGTTGVLHAEGPRRFVADAGPQALSQFAHRDIWSSRRADRGRRRGGDGGRVVRFECGGIGRHRAIRDSRVERGVHQDRPRAAAFELGCIVELHGDLTGTTVKRDVLDMTRTGVIGPRDIASVPGKFGG